MKKSNFGLFFKKLPDDYLFESMIIFCIFFGAIPETHFPRDIKFNLSSVPAQCVPKARHSLYPYGGRVFWGLAHFSREGGEEAGGSPCPAYWARRGASHWAPVGKAWHPAAAGQCCAVGQPGPWRPDAVIDGLI